MTKDESNKPAAKFVIVRRIDGRAIMEGSHSCEVRWGRDVGRVREYDSAEQAQRSLGLLCYEDDHAYVCAAAAWRHWAARFDCDSR